MRRLPLLIPPLRRVANQNQPSYYNFLEKDSLPFLSTVWSQQSRVLQNPLSLEASCDIKNISTYLEKVQASQALKHSLIPRKEFLIVGRSNVGKSSLINMLTLQKAAMTSNYPGKTRNLFFFNIGDSGLVLVDAPGYGFAKGYKEELLKWGKMIVKYLDESTNLYRVVCLVDAEHGFKDTDFMLFDLLEGKQKPFMICFTKCDKIATSSMETLFESAAEKVKKYGFCSPILNATSAKSGYGMPEFRANLVYLLNAKSQ